MNRYLLSALMLFLASSIFMFGWLSHSAYTPAHSLEPEVKIISAMEDIKKRRTLDVVILNTLSTYYIGTRGEQGFEYDLLKSYAQHLGVELNVTTAETTKEAMELARTLKPHITSSALSKTILKKEGFNVGPSYEEVQEQVVCNSWMQDSNTFPRSIEELGSVNLVVGEGTSYAQTIKNLQRDGFDINATTTSEFSTEELLAKVSGHEIDCTIVNSNIYSINLRYFPEIALAFPVSGREQLAWILTDNSEELAVDMYAWLNNFNQSGKMAELKDFYYSRILSFDYVNTKMFYKRIKSRLPKYQKYFEDAGKNYDIPWTLLASISYQESHWNPKAKSFTGVRGMMMLTRATAKMLGIKNRLDPKQSIIGGARHIKQMLKIVPKDVVGENRIKFALAAYNIGLGHILDARKLAREHNLDPKSWNDLKKVLPLLSQKKYYKTLKYGYARGSEPVKYVESIYNYRNILEKMTQDLSLNSKQ